MMPKLDHELLNEAERLSRRYRPREILNLDALTNQYLMAIEYDDYREDNFTRITEEIGIAEKERLV